MRSKKRTIGILIAVIVVLLGFVGSLLVYRNKLSSENKKNNSNNTAQSLSSAPSGRSIEDFYDKPITDEKIALDSIEVNRGKLGYSDKNFTFIYDEKSGSETSYHFDLYYKDIPVYEKGVGVFTHYSDNSAKVLMSNVSDAEKIIKVNTIQKITEDEALNIAKEILGANFSEYNIGANFEKVKVKPKLIIYKYNDEYNLAYYIQSGFYMCVINAESGDIITAHSILVSKSTEYEGQRKGDTQQIFYDDVTNSDDGELKDNALYCMEKNIYILDDLEKGKLDFKKLLTLNDIESGKNKSAVDAMANTYKAIKYFEKIDIDISFLAIYVQVNDTDELKNKFPNKTLASACISQNDEKTKTYAYLNFGTKDMSGRQYSAYLDVVAHEYTHCVTNLKAFGSEGYKKDSIYFERNALMEAYSDIFGELIEQKCTGDTDWKVADSSLIEPTFGSEYKYKYSKKRKTKDDEGTDENDYGYAHDNSTIISHAAYLMSKSNDSKKYDAEFLLDYNQLAQLWYGSLEYLKKTEFKDFADCRYAIEQSAMDLIEKGVLIDGNLNIIEQAFNEVEVSSNPARRGTMDSAEIKEKHTATVSIEDETQSTEPVEIEELNYDWYISPTIEAEDIIVSDVEKINYYGFNANPFDEYSIVSENGKYRFIKYDGTYISDKQYDEWYFSKPDAITCSSKNNECVTILGENGNEISYEPHDSGWGRKGYYIDNKTKEIYSTEYDSVSKYNESDNIVVQSADITITSNEQNSSTLELNNVGKYGIANSNGLVVDCIYDDACMNIGSNIISLEKDGKWGCFNEDGTQIIDFVCEPFESKILDVMWLHNHDGESIQHPFLSSSGYIPVKINGQCGYYDTQGNEVIPCGTFEDARPVHNGLAWVKKDGKWGVIKLINAEQEITDDLIVQTENLTNSDIKTEWEHVTSLDLEYPIFITSNNELKNFLDTAISEKILSYMETDTDYNLRIDGGFEYDMSIDGYLSINGYISNHAEGGNGFYGYSCYTFFVDLQNRKILTLNELFSEPENVVYNEIATKTNQYINGDIKSGLLSTTALSDYDYRNCKFTLNKDNLTIIFNPYEVTTGIVGVVTIEIPISDLSLTCIIPEIKTKGFQNENKSKTQSESTETQTDTTAVSDNEILKAVNKYLEENQSNLGVWLSDGNPYCPSGYMASNDKNWSCPINTDWDRYSSNEIAGAYPHFAYVDKSTLKCTLTANYETVVEFDLSAYLK